jgi:hypothetical protein
MDLWSKGLGRRVLSMTLGERETLAVTEGYLVMEGIMHAPTYWDYQVSLEEDDIVEFLELLQKPDSLRFLATNEGRGRIYRTAAVSAVIFLWRTVRLALTGSPGGATGPAKEVLLRRVAEAEPEEDWDDAIVDWASEDPALSATTEPNEEGRSDAGT